MCFRVTLLNKVFSIVYIGFISISSALFFCIACVIRLVTALFDRRRIITNTFSAFWASVYIWCMPAWSVKIIDRHKLSLKKNYVLVSNHQSQVDILVLYRLLFPYRWVSKAAVFNLPFIGWNMVLNGDIKLKRGDSESIALMMDRCESLLKKNISVFFFPEGTRSRDGRVGPFKPGAFILAKNAGVPIQPVVINHTRDALPKHSLTIGRQKQMEVKILDEIPVSEFGTMAPEEIAEMVRSKIVAHVYEHRHPGEANQKVPA
ncbi:MAG: 1-acyl-sn-glycerol-3-phosphate acyltransferase [Desulfobacterales bacterium]|nr:1-acyl-sn-glycerol-3-phosphate acyltransferase [Desulfobacterales bacterium]